MKLADLDARYAELEGEISAVEGKPLPVDGSANEAIRSHAERARARIVGILRQEAVRIRHEREGLDIDLSRMVEREMIQRSRPISCFCLGLGGRGGFIAIGPGGEYGLWSMPCLNCREGWRMHADAAGYIRSVNARAVEVVEPADGDLDEYLDRLDRAGVAVEKYEGIELETLYVDAGKSAAWDLTMGLIDAAVDQWHGKRIRVRRTKTDSQYNAIAVAEYPALGRKPFIYLHGPTGTGKSTIAACALKCWARKARPGLFVNVGEWIKNLRATFDRRDDAGPSTASILEPARSARLLVLDDFGVETPTPYVRAVLYELVNHRYEYRLPTIITSNVPLTVAAARLGGDRIESDRIASRLAEVCDVAKVEGRDFRAEPLSDQEREEVYV